MIALRLQGIGFENEFNDITKIFHTDTYNTNATSADTPSTVTQSAGTPSASHGDILLNGRETYTNGQIFYTIELVEDGKILNTYDIPIPQGIPVKLTPAYRDLKREIKRGIYSLLSGYLGQKPPWGILTGIRPAKIVQRMLDEGKTKAEIYERLTNYYLINENKAKLLYDVALSEERILGQTPANSISLYIGIPFCPTRCLYCSFTSYPIERYSSITAHYLDALKREIIYTDKVLKDHGLLLQSVYIGGGTPTAMETKLLMSLVDFIENNLDIENLQEFTLEAGRPDTIDSEKLTALKKSAVDRISINPQTMHSNTLRAIGREHSPEDTVRAFLMARETGFQNINMDVIAGLPGEDPEMFDETMEQIAKLRPDSLTVHTLALKRGSRLAMEGGSLPTGKESDAVRMLDSSFRHAEGMGMHPYYIYRQKNILGNLENVGYSRPGCESIYNVQIMEEKQTIIGIGAGAVTKIVLPLEGRIERIFNVKNVDEYIARVDEMIERKRVNINNRF